MAEKRLEKYEYETDRGMVNLSADTVRRYLVPDGSNVTDQEVTLFLELCKYQKLNPFLREAYLVKYGNAAASIVTGKEVFTQRAQADPNFAGFEAGITVANKQGIKRRDGSLLLPNEKLVGGWAKVYIKGYTVPFFDEVSFAEYAGKKKDGGYTKMWLEKPATMIRKVALVHALREAFPDKFKGLYSQEEINTIDQQLPTQEVEPIIKKKVEKDDPEDEQEEIADQYEDYYTDDMPGEDTEPEEGMVEYEYDALDDAMQIRPADVVIGFGKHQGKTIASIAATDRGYIDWLSREGRDADIREACSAFLASTRSTASPAKRKRKAAEPEQDPLDMDDTVLPFDI